VDTLPIFDVLALMDRDDIAKSHPQVICEHQHLEWKTGGDQFSNARQRRRAN
jgi:hypothetical protein